MLAASTSVDAIEMAGEIGALLLESHLIKHWQPAFNTLLLQSAEPWVLVSHADTTRLASMRSSEARATGLLTHGLFSCYREAESALLALIRHYRLCPALSGLEQLTRGRGCFSRQLGKCDGACVGAEPMHRYQMRLRSGLHALNAASWPYAGAIGIVEQGPALRQVHVIDHWCYRGSLQGRKKAPPRKKCGGADMDVYRIIAAPLRAGLLQVVALD